MMSEPTRAPQARPQDFAELVALVATRPHEKLAEALARQMIVMGALDGWEAETIEHVAEQTQKAVEGLGLPTFTNTCGDDDALRLWCTLDPDTSFAEWAERYGWEVPCEHRWQLVEDGYSRFWHVTVDDDGTVRAMDSSFSDDGDGPVLNCLDCDETREIDGEVRYL